MNGEARHAAFRMDRTLTLRMFTPLRSVMPRQPRLRVLMYHSISDQLDEGVHAYYRTVTSPRRFAEQMEFLRASGYQFMTLTQGLQWARSVADERMTSGTASSDSDGPVIVTFDDGFRDFQTAAFPVLQRLRIPSTVFLATSCLDGHFITGQECLRRAEVARLAAQGVEFGSHTVTHPRLVELGYAAVDEELRKSRDDVEQIVGARVATFSYPYRFPEEDTRFTAGLCQLLSDCGYDGGVTTRIGRSTCRDNPYILKRLPVNDDDDPAFFKAKLDGAYDWMHAAQLARKRIRRVLRSLRRER